MAIDFNVNEEDKKLTGGGSFFKFGLNQMYFTKIGIKEEVGRTPQLEIKYKPLNGDKEMNRWIYLNPDDGKVSQDTVNDRTKQLLSVVKWILLSLGVTREQIDAKNASLKSGTTLVEGIEAQLTLLPKDYPTKKLDVFMRYQYSIATGKTQTYLEIPNNMFGGHFICPAQSVVGEWKEVRDTEGLHYVDNAGNKHPFTRDNVFLEGAYGKQQGSTETKPKNTAFADVSAETWDKLETTPASKKDVDAAKADPWA
ncbi:MAG: hypothetical protein ACRC0V_01650 [Fusobacteriaceae bacterium]